MNLHALSTTLSNCPLDGFSLSFEVVVGAPLRLVHHLLFPRVPLSSLPSCLHLFEPLDLRLQRLCAALTISRHLVCVCNSHRVVRLVERAVAGNRLCSHGETHILGSVDELQNGRGCLVLFEWLDTQDTCITARTFCIARSDCGEEFGYEFKGTLRLGVSGPAYRKGTQGRRTKKI